MARLHRSRTNRMLGGVIGGIAAVTGIEATLLRWVPFIATVIVYILFGGEVMLVFIIALILLYAGYWFSFSAK